MKQFGRILSFSCIICVLIISCDKDNIKNKQFTYWGEYTHANEIRLEGIYVNMDEDSVVLDIIVLYENGLLFHSYYGSCEGVMLREVASRYCKIEEVRDRYHFWGAFIIEEDKLQIQSPQMRAGGQLSDLHIWNYNGILHNDTSFTIQKRILHNGDIEEWNDLFVFYPVRDKPDSMNILIEELGAP